MIPVDQELLERALDGDEGAYTALYRLRQGAVYRFALHMSGSAAVAEDVTQDTFLELLTAGRRYDASRGTLRSFLFGMARNFVLRRIGRNRDEPLEDESADGHDLLGDLTRRETIEQVRCAVLTAAPGISRGGGFVRPGGGELRGSGGGAGMPGGNGAVAFEPGPGDVGQKADWREGWMPCLKIECYRIEFKKRCRRCGKRMRSGRRARNWRLVWRSRNLAAEAAGVEVGGDRRDRGGNGRISRLAGASTARAGASDLRPGGSGPAFD